MKIGMRGIFLISHTIKITLSAFVLISASLYHQDTGMITKQGITQSGIILKKGKSLLEIKPGLPIHIKIPKIHVNANFEYVGVTPEGAMHAPKNPAKVAWFNLGPRPGEIGNAVIVGHYGSWKSGAKSVFDNLHTLKKGDYIYIEDKNKIQIAFIIKKIRRYNPQGDTTDIFNSSDEKVHLNLITCDGIWNNSSEQYSKRLVIFTDKVGK